MNAALMVLTLKLAIYFYPVSTTAATNDIVNSGYVGVIIYPDVAVYDQLGFKPKSTVLPLGCLVVFDDLRSYSKKSINTAKNHDQDQLEWLYIRFPLRGWVTAKSIQKSSTGSIASLPLWESLPQLYSAGHGVMASQKLSLGWLDQWPIGTGGIGTLIFMHLVL